MAKKFMDKKEREVSRFSVGNFLSHSAEIFRKTTLLCFVSEKFREPKSLWIRGGYNQEFLSKFFALTVPKNFLGEHFVVSLLSGIENFFA